MKRIFLLFVFLVIEIAADDAADAWASRQRQVKPAKNATQSRFSGRIVGGEEVDVANFPYQLSLRENGFHICGASVIAPNWALTAAHCQSPPSEPSKLTFLGGTNQRSNDSSGVVFEVDQIICHPKFQPQTYARDVCVIHVTTSFLDHPNISIIPLAATGSKIKANSFATVSGWGLTAAKAFLASTLRAVDVPITTRERCETGWNPVPIPAGTICAGGQPGRDSCNGDSGSPLVQDGQQIGIVSWGDENCGSSLPGIYTHVANANIRAFIEKHTGV